MIQDYEAHSDAVYWFVSAYENILFSCSGEPRTSLLLSSASSLSNKDPSESGDLSIDGLSYAKQMFFPLSLRIYLLKKLYIYLHYIVYFTEYLFRSLKRFLRAVSIGATGQDQSMHVQISCDSLIFAT